MPAGKRAGERCIQLDEANRCRLFGRPERPRVCLEFRAEVAICGNDREDAMRLLTMLED